MVEPVLVLKTAYSFWFDTCQCFIDNFLIKKDSFGLKEKNKNLSSKLEIALQEKVEFSNECDSLKTQLELVLNENKILKNKNDCNEVLKKNEF